MKKWYILLVIFTFFFPIIDISYVEAQDYKTSEFSISSVFIKVVNSLKNVLGISSVGEDIIPRILRGPYNLAASANNTANNLKWNEVIDLITFSPSNLVGDAVSAIQVRLTWQDNSNNEQGFIIERRTIIPIPIEEEIFRRIAVVGPDIQTFLDEGLVQNTQYEYRIRAYNYAGESAYSNIVRVTTPQLPPNTYTLTVNKQGTGSGTVRSNPIGINCGIDCNENYLEGTQVILTATAAQGSVFAGWEGCEIIQGEDNPGGTGTSNCRINMNSVRTVTATFRPVQQQRTFTVSVIKEGTGDGTVRSDDNRINCGDICLATYYLDGEPLPEPLPRV